MVDEWKPNAPDINKDFQNAHANKKAQEQKSKRDMVTKVELDKLESQRGQPNAEPTPTPPGGAEKTGDYQQAFIKREQRIKYIKERMDAAQDRLRKGFENNK
jgi:hypothetical protein